jgi:hypothetical protein
MLVTFICEFFFCNFLLFTSIQNAPWGPFTIGVRTGRIRDKIRHGCSTKAWEGTPDTGRTKTDGTT